MYYYINHLDGTSDRLETTLCGTPGSYGVVLGTPKLRIKNITRATHKVTCKRCLKLI